jgi:hypothetical protein
MAPGIEGGWTTYEPEGEVMTIYDAAMKYKAAGVALLVIAGREYGSGSSRDWAAKGTLLLGVRAVIAESYERIHRSNLVNMGVLPLQFQAGKTAASFGLTGRERYDVTGVGQLSPGGAVGVRAQTAEGPREVRADLVVAADGRHSVVREKAGLAVKELGAPMDVLWFRLSRTPDDSAASMGRFDAGRIFITLNRGDYWQCGYVIPKGQFEAARGLGLSPGKTMALVILPQAIAIVTPGLLNVAVAIVKETTVILIIGLLDFFNEIVAGLADPQWLQGGGQVLNTGYFFAALVYWAVCFGLSRVSARLELAKERRG